MAEAAQNHRARILGEPFSPHGWMLKIGASLSLVGCEVAEALGVVSALSCPLAYPHLHLILFRFARSHRDLY